MQQPSFAKAPTCHASSFEVKVHSSPVTVIPHIKPGYRNIGSSCHLEELDCQVNHHIDSGIIFAIVPIKKINSLFAMGIFNKKNPVFIDGSVSSIG